MNKCNKCIIHHSFFLFQDLASHLLLVLIKGRLALCANIIFIFEAIPEGWRKHSVKVKQPEKPN